MVALADEAEMGTELSSAGMVAEGIVKSTEDVGCEVGIKASGFPDVGKDNDTAGVGAWTREGYVG